MTYRIPALLYVLAAVASSCTSALAQDAAPIPGASMTVGDAAQAAVVAAAGILVLWNVFDKATGGAKKRRETLEKNKRALYGEKGLSPGLVARVEALEAQGAVLHDLRELMQTLAADEEQTTGHHRAAPRVE